MAAICLGLNVLTPIKDPSKTQYYSPKTVYWIMLHGAGAAS